MDRTQGVLPGRPASPGAQSTPAISVHGLRKTYGENEAVRGIDFEVAPGEVFGFLGPNGAGKTTTIEILEGYRERTAGEVTVLGIDPGDTQPASGVPASASSCRSVSSIRCSRSRETMKPLFELLPQRAPGRTRLCELVGLETGKRDARVGSLSGGQQRRLDVGVGIIGNPELLFLDEPTTGFDPSARRDAWNMIEGLKELGTTIVLTTHYMDEAQHLADRVVIMREGGIVAEGAPETLGEQLGRETMIRFRTYDGVADRASARSAVKAVVSGQPGDDRQHRSAARPLPTAELGRGARGSRCPTSRSGGQASRTSSSRSPRNRAGERADDRR